MPNAPHKSGASAPGSSEVKTRTSWRDQQRERVPGHPGDSLRVAMASAELKVADQEITPGGVVEIDRIDHKEVEAALAQLGIHPEWDYVRDQVARSASYDAPPPSYRRGRIWRVARAIASANAAWWKTELADRVKDIVAHLAKGVLTERRVRRCLGYRRTIVEIEKADRVVGEFEAVGRLLDDPFILQRLQNLGLIDLVLEWAQSGSINEVAQHRAQPAGAIALGLQRALIAMSGPDSPERLPPILEVATLDGFCRGVLSPSVAVAVLACEMTGAKDAQRILHGSSTTGRGSVGPKATAARKALVRDLRLVTRATTRERKGKLEVVEATKPAFFLIGASPESRDLLRRAAARARNATQIIERLADTFFGLSALPPRLPELWTTIPRGVGQEKLI